MHCGKSPSGDILFVSDYIKRKMKCYDDGYELWLYRFAAAIEALAAFLSRSLAFLSVREISLIQRRYHLQRNESNGCAERIEDINEPFLGSSFAST